MKSNYTDELCLYDDALQTLLNIVRCKEYLFNIGNLDEWEPYDQFVLKTDSVEHIFSAHMNFDKDDVWIELASGTIDTSIRIARNCIEFFTTDENYEIVPIFSVFNTLDIKDEASFFQASTEHDLSAVPDGEHWFMRIVDKYNEIAYIVESDK